MFKSRLVFAFVLLACSASLWAQAPRINPEAPPSSEDAQLASLAALFEQRPEAQSLNQIVNTLSNLSKVSAEKKAEAKQLASEAAPFQKAGNTGEARRRLSHAIAILLGKSWNEAQEFGTSLALRTDLVVADLNKPFLLSLSQSYPMQYAGKNPLKLRLSVTEAAPRIAIDVVIPSGKALQTLMTRDLPNRDLIDNPARFDVDMKALAAGSYLLIADVLEGDTQLIRMATPIYLAKDIAARQRAIELKAAKIKGSKENSTTMATIRYPFQLAEGLNARQVKITSFDFAGQIKRSEELVAALAKGKDLLLRAKGHARRNYVLTEANEIMPYRVYVPTNWDGKKKLPMILALHGGNLDENNMLDRGEGVMGKLAEQYGFIVASPLGYRVNGGYGTLVYGTWGANNPVTSPTAAQLRLWDLSEKDVLNVMELVAREYNVDRSRIYMMGNSMGAGGTWYLASKYAEKFVGLAPCASSMNVKALSFEKFKNMPVLACVGELDTDIRKEAAKYGISKVSEVSANAQYLPVPNGTHGSGVQIAMPQIFEFFSKNTKPH